MLIGLNLNHFITTELGWTAFSPKLGMNMNYQQSGDCQLIL